MASLKLITSALVLVFLGCTGYLLYHIVFILPSGTNEAVEELLHIIPLVVLSLSTYLIGNLIKKSDILEALDCWHLRRRHNPH